MKQSLRYSILHTTSYDYSESVSYSQHLAHFKPLETPRQRVISYSLETIPKADTYALREDYFNNTEEYFTIISPYKRFQIYARSEVELEVSDTLSLDLSPSWEVARDRLKNPTNTADREACEFTYASAHCPVLPELAEYAQTAFTPGTPLLSAALELNRLIHKEFRFDAKATNVTTSVEQIYEKKAGVCQDFAHFQISALRSLGLAARYVSGYIRTAPPEGQKRLIGADASHAWIALYVPDIGWVEYDSTNNIIPSRDHITVAYGRDYDDICPVRGIVYGGGTQTLNVGVTVTPLA